MTHRVATMRVLGPAITVFLMAIPRVASAQCPSSVGITCSRIDPAQFEFGVQTPPKRPTLKFVSSPPAAAAAQPAQPPIDCAMVKPVDPKFASTMPVIPADAKRLPMKVVHVPSCKN